MNRNPFKLILVVTLLATISQSNAVLAGLIVTVPGHANPFLAGLPDGATAQVGDRAPQQSPIEVSGILFSPGDVLHFSAAGAVSYNSNIFNGPDGGFVFSRGAENGIAGYTIPVNALVGVFLGPTRPDLTAAPVALDFGTGTSRDFLTLSPLLKQPFFIGDGVTSSSVTQGFVVPTGASRFYLGTTDGVEWSNNSGSFSVEITNSPVPEPSSLLLLVVGGLGCVVRTSLRQRYVKTADSISERIVANVRFTKDKN